MRMLASGKTVSEIAAELELSVKTISTYRTRVVEKLRFKNNAARGGVLQNIHVRNITVGQVATAAVSIDFFYEEGPKGSFKPVVRDVSVEKMTTQKAKYAFYLRGFSDSPIEHIEVADCDFNGVEQPNVIENAKDITLRNVRVNGKEIERLA